MLKVLTAIPNLAPTHSLVVHQILTYCLSMRLVFATLTATINPMAMVVFIHLVSPTRSAVIR